MVTTRSRRLLALGAVSALTAAALGAGAHAATADTPVYLCSDNTQPIAPESSLTVGQPVTTKTVLSGTTPTTLSGEYIGKISDGIAPGEDMLLMRLQGVPVTSGADGDIAGGGWAGMSGSPVYDSSGKLIGSMSYGLTASATNIVGVTPIEAMKAIGTTTAAAPASKTRVKVTRANGSSRSVDALAGSTFSQLKAVPVATGRTNSKLTKALATYSAAHGKSNLFSETGGATSAKRVSTTYPIIPGGNLFVGYSSGDTTLGGLGTVTAVCGNDVWGFGHPMDYLGTTKLSIAGASAAAIVPDDTGLVGSFKQADTIGAPVGTITQDRLSGVKGTLTSVPAGIAIKSTYKGPLGTKTMSSKVYGQQNLSLIGLYQTYGNAGEAMDSNRGSGDVGIAVVYKNAAGTSGTARASQFESDPGGVGVDQAFDTLDWLGYFEDAPIDNTINEVRISGTLSERLKARNLGAIQVKSGSKWKTVSKLTAKRGSKVTYRTLLNPAVGTGLKVTATPAVTFTIPKTAVGQAEVDVFGGYSDDDYSDYSDGDEDTPTTWSSFLKEFAGSRHDVVTSTLAVYSAKDISDDDDGDDDGPTPKTLSRYAVGATVSGYESLMITVKR